MLGLRRLVLKFRLGDIKYIVWDFDGTLYQDEKTYMYIKRKYLAFLNSKVKTSMENFDILSQKYGHWGSTISKVLKTPEIKVLDKIENNKDFDLNLNANPALVKKIEELCQYQHFILTNSSSSLVKKSLKQIGFIKKKNLTYFPFQKIFSRSVTHVLKPNKKAFLSITRYTGEPARKHLVIGDSYNNDIKPAKDLGFQAADINYFWKEIWPLLKQKSNRQI